MTAPHFFVEPSALRSAGAGDVVDLSASDSRHALRSLRLRAGEEVTLADGEGRWCSGRLVGGRSGVALVELQESREIKSEFPALRVLLAPPKGERLSWAVQKLAELGVDEVVMIPTERGVRTATGAQLERLRAVAREAAMQSRRPFLMKVGEGATRLGPEAGLIRVMLDPSGESGLLAGLAGDPSAVELLVGPEGGFTDDEMTAAKRDGVVAASLGSGVLRTETAAVVGAALVLARYGRLG